MAIGIAGGFVTTGAGEESVETGTDPKADGSVEIGIGEGSVEIGTGDVLGENKNYPWVKKNKYIDKEIKKLNI